MAQNVTAAVTLSIKVNEVLAIALATGNVATSTGFNKSFGAGTGPGNIQRAWTKSATATAAAVTYTLSALLDDLGRTIPVATCRLMLLLNEGTDPLTVGGAAVHPWAAPFADISDKLIVPAGGVFLLGAPGAAGLAVSSGVSDQLKIDPGAQTVAFKLLFLGE